jgi:steroid delta-isomerase-like uncharacterized protein
MGQVPHARLAAAVQHHLRGPPGRGGPERNQGMANRQKLDEAVAAFNAHDAGRFAACYAPDAIVYDPQYPEPLRGRGAIEQDMADFYRAFPDVTNRLETTLEDGEMVAARFSISGTHSGPLALPTGEVPATGRRVTFEGAVFSRYNGQGLIVEERRYYDVAGQAAQLGIA